MPLPLRNLYERLVRPALFQLPPETAQGVVDLVLSWERAWTTLYPSLHVEQQLGVEWCGMTLRNPVGLAAGFDKDCVRLASLAALGFGYVTCGTVTEHPLPGNPKPRLIRLAGEESLLNAMGFPNKGVASAARHIEAARGRMNSTPVIVSISGTSPAEVIRCHRRLEPIVEAVEVNISSPNTSGLRVFHNPQVLRELLDGINDSRQRPLAVKLPPYSGSEPSHEDRSRTAALVRECVGAGVDGLTVSNSRPVTDSRLSVGNGGLSGKPLLRATLAMVSDVRAEAGSRISINACGGISIGADVHAALTAGADTVQVYTALVYRGPDLVRRINRELLDLMGCPHGAVRPDLSNVPEEGCDDTPN